jgi:ubiquinone biosynthesis protein
MTNEIGFRVPALDWSRTGQRVLTTEWINGTPLRDPQAVRAAGHDPKRIAIVVLQTFLVQSLRDGFFHADMHPGNLFLDREGRVCAVDFGIMGRLDPRLRRFMAETLGGFLARDYVRVANVHFEMGFVPRHHNVDNFAQALRAIGEPVFGLRARDVSMARLLEQLFETTRRFDMQLQPQLVLMQKTMMVVEGVSRTLDPEFDIWGASQPVVQSWVLDNIGPEARLREAAEGLSALGRLAQTAPLLIRNTESIATMVADGGVKLHPESVSAIAHAQTRRTRHVRIAIWIAALALSLIALAML